MRCVRWTRSRSWVARVPDAARPYNNTLNISSVTPTFASSQDSSAVSAWGNGYDPAKATSLLESAGFHMGSDGIMVNSAGQKLQFGLNALFCFTGKL